MYICVFIYIYLYISPPVPWRIGRERSWPENVKQTPFEKSNATVNTRLKLLVTPPSSQIYSAAPVCAPTQTRGDRRARAHCHAQYYFPDSTHSLASPLSSPLLLLSLSLAPHTTYRIFIAWNPLSLQLEKKKLVGSIHISTKIKLKRAQRAPIIQQSMH